MSDGLSEQPSKLQEVVVTKFQRLLKRHRSEFHKIVFLLRTYLGQQYLAGRHKCSRECYTGKLLTKPCGDKLLVLRKRRSSYLAVWERVRVRDKSLSFHSHPSPLPNGEGEKRT